MWETDLHQTMPYSWTLSGPRLSNKVIICVRNATFFFFFLPPHHTSCPFDIIWSSHPVIHMIYRTLFKWLMMQSSINQWAASGPGSLLSRIRKEMFWGHHFHQSFICQYAWQGFVDVSVSNTHTHKCIKHIFLLHTLARIYFASLMLVHLPPSLSSVVLCEEPSCRFSGRRAWIILLVLMFSIILNPPGMVYSCPLPSLSDSCSHPSVSYVILPQINTGHHCSNFIRPCGVGSSYRWFAPSYRHFINSLLVLVCGFITVGQGLYE